MKTLALHSLLSFVHKKRSTVLLFSGVFAFFFLIFSQYNSSTGSLPNFSNSSFQQVSSILSAKTSFLFAEFCVEEEEENVDSNQVFKCAKYKYFSSSTSLYLSVCQLDFNNFYTLRRGSSVHTPLYVLYHSWRSFLV